MNELALFAGAGGGLLASRLLGWTTVGAVEIEPYPAGILRQRQQDGHLDPFPIWDDVRTFDGRPWRGCIDVVSGGFPCQDISSAGKRAGIEGARSGLYREMLRIIGEVRPPWVFAENVPGLRTNGLAVVLQGLAGLGYDAAWGVLGASHFGAPHRRNRMWIVAHAAGERQQGGQVCRVSSQRRGEALHAGNSGAAPTPHAHSGGDRDVTQHAKVGGASATGRVVSGRGGDAGSVRVREQPGWSCGQGGTTAGKWRDEGEAFGLWALRPDIARVVDGVAHRVDRIRATGNGQVPCVAAAAWHILSDILALA